MTSDLEPSSRAADSTVADRNSPRARRPAPTDTLPDPPSGELLPAEEALVALCCATRSAEAVELLSLYEPSRSPLLLRSAQAISQLDRAGRLANLARTLSHGPAVGGLDKLNRELDGRPAWLRRLALPWVPPPLRPLMASRPEHETNHKPHPALRNWARRFVARNLSG